MLRIADLFPLILTASFAALIASPIAVRIANSLGLVDVPGSAPHKQHTRSTPDAGGIALAVALAVGMLVFRFPLQNDVGIILLGTLLIGLWGMWDDRVGLSPFRKLIGQVLAATILVWGGIQVRIFAVSWLNLGLTYLWVVGLINAFNFVDSMDGLALGLGGIAAAFFMLVTVDSGQIPLAQLAAILVGAAGGLYYFNALPARLFLGDAGAQMLGLILAALGVAYSPVGLPQEVSWFTPVLVLAIPIFDTVLVSLDRLLRGYPLYIGQLDHTYHRLRQLGFSRNRAVLSMHLSAAVLGLVSFIALDLSPLGANILNLAVLLCGLAMLLFFLRVQPSSHASDGKGNGEKLENEGEG